jgi:predicted RNA binding protein YcfA (HicA-like mRNA interferase family)
MPPSGKKVVKALEKDGFRVVRVRGSHHIMESPDGRRATVHPER